MKLDLGKWIRKAAANDRATPATQVGQRLAEGDRLEELDRVALAQVAGGYIGETEKNLRR
jgi:hypothetical protein